jgi:Domain of unknown function (DUF4178)
MSLTVTDEQLRQLKVNDRLTDRGTDWQVRDYATYQDPQGYGTEEWQLVAGDITKYLLRETDPAVGHPVWYLAEELKSPSIVAPGDAQDLYPKIAQRMIDRLPPYPVLNVRDRPYKFESRTEGNYQKQNKTSHRITWDYWDQPHRLNLALEAWDDKSLDVYSTQLIRIEDLQVRSIAQPDYSGVILGILIVAAIVGIMLFAKRRVRRYQ